MMYFWYILNIIIKSKLEGLLSVKLLGFSNCTLDHLEGLTICKHFAGHTVAERRIFCQFAATDVHHVDLLIQTEFERLESSAMVARITEGLLLRHATTAPIVVLRSEDRVLHFIGRNTGRNWEGMLSVLFLQTPLVVSFGVFDDGNVGQGTEGLTQVRLQVLVPIFH